MSRQESANAQASSSEPPAVKSAAQTMSAMRGNRQIDLEKETQFSDAWIVLAVILSLTGIILGNSFLTATALTLFVVAGLSKLWANFSLFGLHYRRRFSERRAFMGETVKLTLEVQNQKFLPLAWLQIIDSFPIKLPLKNIETVEAQATPGEALIASEFRSFWMLGAFQRVTREFSLECTTRGFHTFGPAKFHSGDGFGLFDRKGRSTAEDRLIVYPRLYPVEALNLPAKNPFGAHISRQLLFEDPLRTKGIREWQPADRLSRIHWKAVARHQQLLSRVYEPDEEPQMLIFLNVATMIRHWQGNFPELQERTISVAASLAALCAEQRLPVGLIANGVYPGSDQPLRLLPGRNPDQLTHILEMLAAVSSFASRPIETLLLQEAPRLPWGATIIVVTALTHADLLSSLLTLHHAGRRVMLFTLAEEPPQLSQLPSNMPVYHLPHLSEDIIRPQALD